MADDDVDTRKTLSEQLGEAFDQVSAGEPAEEPADEPDDDTPGEDEPEAEASSEESADTEAEDTAEDTEDTETEEITVIDPPEHWNAADKEMFVSLPSQNKEWLLDKTKSLEDGYRTKFEEVASVRRQGEALDDICKPFDEELALQGMSREDGIRRLITAHQSLRSKPEETIRWLAQQYRVNLDQPAQETNLDDRIDPDAARELIEVRTQLTDLQNSIAQSKQAEESQRTSGMQSQIDTFRDAKDDSDNPKYPHFETLRETMGGLIQSGSAKTLEQAYDMALWTNADLRKDLIPKVDKDAQRKKEVSKAKKASKQVETTPTLSADRAKAGNLKDEIGRVYDEVASA